jgi:V/A-type H+/Na+-transporting ATPase subunit I
VPLARMSKVQVLAPREFREALVDRLHDIGAVQVRDLASQAQESEDLKDFHRDFDPDTRNIRLEIAKTEFILELLERFEGQKMGLISGFLKEKTHLSYEEYMNLASEFDLDGIYHELEEIDVDLRQAEANVSESKEEVRAMLPWQELDLPLARVREVASTELRLVIEDPARLDLWLAELEKRCPRSVWEEVHREKDRVYIAGLIHKVDIPEFDVLASETGIEQIQFGEKAGTISDEIAAAEERMGADSELGERLEAQVRESIPLKGKVSALHDFFSNELAKEEAKGKFIHTESVVALEGWVEESRTEEISEGLKLLGQKLDVSFEPAGEDDIPPTQLVNRRRIRPSESLIQLFGLPEHSETDPTPFVAPFFIIFFGMCIGDVVYGLILTLGFWLAIKKLDVSQNAKKFFRLFMYCGIATIVAGIITRGYFGIEGESLPGFLKFPGTMDILNNPVPIMLICAALGLIHISVGVAIEMWDNMRNNSVWLGICEQGTTLVLWFGIAVTAVGYGVKFRPLGLAGVYLMLAGVAGIVFLSNIGSKSIPGKFFGGLLNLYGLFGGTIGDVASYLRLYALGLATVAIGSVVNRMAFMTFGIPVLGILFLLIIMVGGHIFNLSINFLGAFVHPLRLQYVEFFGKFYEDGGEPFAPLAVRTSKTVIDDH